MKVETKPIREFLETLDKNASRIGDDDSLLEAGIIDSLRMTELVSYIEKTYGLTVEDDDLMPENFESLSAIVTFLEKRSRR